MFEQVGSPSSTTVTTARSRYDAVQYAVAALGLAILAGALLVILSKTYFLGADSAHHYSRVWYFAQEFFHHARFPLHVRYLESGDALAFPYAPAVYIATSIPYLVFGDRAVTAALVASFVFYGVAAMRARPALRDVRLLALVYANTFLLEGLVSFQFAFIWSLGFFFMFVEAVDRRWWKRSAVWLLLAATTHPFAGVVCVLAYSVFAAIRNRRDIVPLATVGIACALLLAPFFMYTLTTPAVGTTRGSHLIGTLKFMTEYRSLVVVLPLVVSIFAPALRRAFLPVFLAMVAVVAGRIAGEDLYVRNLTRTSHPFYGEYLASPEFDRSLTYRVLEPNDREDGALQIMRSGVTLGQEFFDQSQFRRWWDSQEQYACFLGGKHVDVVLWEPMFKRRFKENETQYLQDLEKQGKAKILYADPRGNFIAYDVRGVRTEGIPLKDCNLWRY